MNFLPPHSNNHWTQIRQDSINEEILTRLKQIELKTMNNNEWLPIETAPDCDETEVLLFHKGEIIIGIKRFKNKEIAEIVGGDFEEYKTEYISGIRQFNPTHWMPLPEPPQN